jgi:signal transduction histidine kinase/BarA-like signal transduction histidine kinase
LGGRVHATPDAETMLEAVQAGQMEFRLMTTKQPLILVIDDLEQGRYAAVRILRAAGFATIEAANGEDGLMLAERERPDLVLLDIRLPDIDGFEVCRRLRKNPNLPSLAIVQTSATFEAAEYRVRALEGGADTFLADPVEPTVLIATVRAMLRLRHAESQLREFDRRKDEFLATVAHELRNPLAPLQHCIELLERAPEDPGALNVCVPIMKRQTQSLIRLVDDLADMSRITQNKLTLRLSSTNILDALDTAVEEHRQELEAKAQTLHVEVPDHPVLVTADAVRLAQVFGNLLANGIRYTPKGGRIEVEMRESGDFVAVSFRDTGEGIEPSDLGRIFDLFVQVAPHRVGLGIGLALVHRIVQMHGGSITADSAGRGAGSTFTVRFPTVGRSAPAPQQEALVTAQFRDSSVKREGARASQPRRVMIVDDNVDAANSLAELLRLMGHQPLVTYRGREALRVYAEFAPDLVLMDIAMPDMDGLETIRKLRAEEDDNAALICTLTAHGKGHAAQAFEAGADAHLVKPVSRADLDAVLARA